MKGETKKLLALFVVFGLIIVSIFSVITWYEVKSITKSDEKEENFPIFVKIFADQEVGITPHEVGFQSMVVNNKGNVKYKWDFGDGQTSTQVNPKHTYKELGSYLCTLTVTDTSSGEEKSDYVNITATKDNPPFAVKIVVDKTDGNRPVTISFDANCFDIDGEIVSYYWEIKQPPFFSYQRVTNYEEKNFSERFFRPGLYEVKLTVKDNGGNAASDYMKIQVYKSKPELVIDQIKRTINSALYYYNQLTALKEIWGKLTGDGSET